MANQSGLTFRSFSWYLFGIVLLVLGGIEVIFLLSSPQTIAGNAFFLLLVFYLSPAAVLVAAILLKPTLPGKRLRGLGVLIVSFLLYYILIIGAASSSGYAFQTMLGPVISSKEFQSSSITSSQNVELFVSTFNGQINVIPSTGDSNQITINATVRGIQALVNSISFNFTDALQKNAVHVISISTKEPTSIATVFSSFFSPSLSIEINAYVPTNENYSSVSLESTNGLISASSVYGSSLNVHTSNGEISLTNTNFSTVSADTCNGVIQADVKGETVSLATTNGQILLTARGAGNYSAASVNGAIYATDVSSTTAAKVQASTTNGAVSLTGKTLITAQSSSTNLSGYTSNVSPGLPYVDLVLETSNGDIVIALA